MIGLLGGETTAPDGRGGYSALNKLNTCVPTAYPSSDLLTGKASLHQSSGICVRRHGHYIGVARWVAEETVVGVFVKVGYQCIFEAQPPRPWLDGLSQPITAKHSDSLVEWQGVWSDAACRLIETDSRGCIATVPEQCTARAMRGFQALISSDPAADVRR